jgi:hypothetical protein
VVEERKHYGAKYWCIRVQPGTVIGKEDTIYVYADRVEVTPAGVSFLQENGELNLFVTSQYVASVYAASVVDGSAVAIVDGSAVAIEEGGVAMIQYGEAPEPFREPTKGERCEAWLASLLQEAGEPMKPKEISELGEDEGYNKRMIGRVRNKLREYIRDTEEVKFSPDNCWEWIGRARI